MEAKKETPLSAIENKQIIEILLPFLNGLPCVKQKINLEVLDKKSPSMCVQQIRGGSKYNFNVVGGYTADFPFALFYKAKANDTDSRLKATAILNDIGLIFENITNDKQPFPALGLDKSCIKLEMTSSPANAGREDNGDEIYSAIYVLTYKQKSKYSR